jgi:hypothetical protein
MLEGASWSITLHEKPRFQVWSTAACVQKKRGEIGRGEYFAGEIMRGIR